VEEIDPTEAVSEASAELSKRSERASDALEWFMELDGLVKRQEAIDELASDMDWERGTSNTAISDLVGDMVDPVQQLLHPEYGKLAT
jgi:hypothetical protein